MLMKDMYTPDFSALIPELLDWNDGKGIDPEAWTGSAGNYALAAGYSLLFWPRFTLHDGYVLRHGFSLKTLREWEATPSGDRKSTEQVMNHLHIDDIHYHSEANEAQLRYLGRTLAEIHEVKLGRDFPDRSFEVLFNDEAGLDPLDYQLTFWQTAG